MSEKDKNIIPGPEDFLKYSAHKMSPEERNAFERKLQKDPFDEEAAEGISSISSEQVEMDLHKLSNSIRNRTRKKEYLLWYRIAASVAVLAIVSSVFFFVIKNRIDKGTGQMIISQSNSTQKEDAKIAESQSLSPLQPEVDKKSISDVPGIKPITKYETKIPVQQGEIPVKSDIDKKSITEVPIRNLTSADRLQEARPAKREITPETGIISQRKDILLNESLEEESKGPASALTQAAANIEMDFQEKAASYIKSQGIMNIPAETKIIHGIVLSSKDDVPLPGVTVKIKGSIQETTTDIRGKFSLPVSVDSAKILVAKFTEMNRLMEMQQKEIHLDDNGFVKIKVEPEILALEEVSFAGYEREKKMRTEPSVSGKASAMISNRIPFPVTGLKGFNEYILKNTNFPASNKSISSTAVVLNFLVRTDGRPDSIIVVKSEGEEYSDEAIRLLRDGPSWVPAVRDGKKVVEATQVKILLNANK